MALKRIIQVACIMVSSIALAGSPVIYLSAAQIASGYTLDMSARYVLAEDASITAPIKIQAANPTDVIDVIFDLNGKTINTSATGMNPYGIEVLASYATIKNGVIRGTGATDGQSAILVGDMEKPVTNVTIEGVACLNCAYGINVSNGVLTRISNSVALSNGAGIYFSSSTSGWATNCEASFNQSDGIDVEDLSYVYITSCIANSNGNVGINALNVSPSSSVVIKNCTAEINGYWGFQTASVYAQLRGNMAYGNAGMPAELPTTTGADNNYNLAAGCSTAVPAMPGYVQIYNGQQSLLGVPSVDHIIDNVSIVMTPTCPPAV